MGSKWNGVLPAIEAYGIPVDEPGDVWKEVSELAKELDYSKSRGHVFTKNYSDSPIMRREKGKWFVNLSFLRRVGATRRRYCERALELFYKAYEECGNVSAMARHLAGVSEYSVGSWICFMTNHLYSEEKERIFSLRLSLRKKIFVEEISRLLEEKSPIFYNSVKRKETPKIRRRVETAHGENANDRNS